MNERELRVRQQHYLDMSDDNEQDIEADAVEIAAGQDEDTQCTDVHPSQSISSAPVSDTASAAVTASAASKVHTFHNLTVVGTRDVVFRVELLHSRRAHCKMQSLSSGHQDDRRCHHTTT